MNKYMSAELWQSSNGFLITETSEKIIKENHKNLSILAGPGAGKTEILAQRANFLLQTGACRSPQKILALSFKVDAAANIKERVNLRCGKELSRRFDSLTFDAFFISLVRRFSSLLPGWIEIPSDFDVNHFDRDWWHLYELTVLNGAPCQFKNTFSPLDLTMEPNSEIVKIWEYCAKNKIADYSMCRSMAFTIVKNNSQVRNLILSTYKYLFLDEFQDTTDSQYDFIKAIFKGSDTIITAVGDTNQMIMGWAGANPKNFENIKNDFDSKIIPLAVNHRSNSKIVDLINHVIGNLTPAGEKPIVYEGTRKEPPPMHCIGAKSFNNAEDEAIYISRYINSIMSNTTLIPGNFALILRQRAQDYFEKTNEVFQRNGFSLRNEDALVVQNGVKIQDLMSEPLPVFWILLIRKKIGFINYTEEKDLERIASSLTGYNSEHDRDYKKLQKYISDLSSCIDFSYSIENAISEIIKVIGNAKIKMVFPQYSSPYLDKVKKSFCILFQDAFDKQPEDVKQAIENYEGINQIKLMTIHKSKGLEFDTVFFVDFHDASWWGLTRAVQQGNVQAQREEKNSLFVGLSRAEERLFFTKNQGNWPPVITELLASSKLFVEMPDL